MKEIFTDKTVLVTGGCGSIGSEIVRQLLINDAKVVRVLDNNEDGHFQLQQYIDIYTPESKPRIRHLIGDVRDKERVKRAMEGVDYVFHAAALKHVPFCEYNPFEAVSTNVVGTQNLVDAAITENVDTFIGVSTDKTVNPVNTMGATKLLAEKIVTNAPIGASKVKFACVRFGNVLGSRGSVIPIFKEQIEKGNTITVTSKEMTRFFMSIAQATSLVLESAKHAKGGETFVLKMPVLRIMDLAEVMIEELAPKYGKKVSDIDIKIIGLRPGEKLYEGLVNHEESKYLRDFNEDMLVLNHSLLSQHTAYGTLEADEAIQYTDHYSKNRSLLSKNEIRTMLYEHKLLD